MGKRTFPALAARLIAYGMAPDTPALLAESVGHADQRLMRTTIEKLAEQLAEESAPATAVILFGALAREEPLPAPLHCPWSVSVVEIAHN